MRPKKSDIKKILVLYKRTAFEEFQRRGQRLNLSERKFKTAFPHFIEAHHHHGDSLRKIVQILKGHEFDVTLRTRSKYDLRGRYDLIITVGGDGTFLRASHRVDSELMMGVNSAPNHSVGALCSVTADGFEKKIAAIREGDYRILELNRLAININGKLTKMSALNDVLLANSSPAGTSRYRLCVNGGDEEQKSSGVWVSSASGSTAAIYAAGGAKMPRLSQKIQYLVREPYKDIRHLIKFKKGLVPAGSAIHFIIQMHDACLFVDGPEGLIRLKFGDHIKIFNASQSLRVIG